MLNEKGDKHRKEDRSNKRRSAQKYSYEYSTGEKIVSGVIVVGGAIALVWFVGNDATVIGTVDDVALVPLAAIFERNLQVLIS